MAHHRLARTAKAHALRAVALATTALAAQFFLVLLAPHGWFDALVPFDGWAIIPAAIVTATIAVVLLPLDRVGRIIVDEIEGGEADGRARNVADEIAIAIGEPAGRVIIHASAVPNVGAFPTPDGVVVVVTRGALDVLRRDELEALVASQFAGMRDGWCRLATRAELGWSAGRAFGYVSIVFGAPFGLFLSALMHFSPRIVEATRDLCADVAAVEATRHPAALAGAMHDLASAAADSHRQDLVRRWFLPISTFLVLPKRLQSTTSIGSESGPARTWTSVEEVAAELHLRADRAEALASGADPREYTGREYRRRWSALGTTRDG